MRKNVGLGALELLFKLIIFFWGGGSDRYVCALSAGIGFSITRTNGTENDCQVKVASIIDFVVDKSSFMLLWAFLKIFFFHPNEHIHEIEWC